MPGEQEPVLVWTFLHRGLSCTWTCLYTTETYGAPGPELHQDVAKQQEPLLLLKVSKLQGPELNTKFRERNFVTTLHTHPYSYICYQDILIEDGLGQMRDVARDVHPIIDLKVTQPWYTGHIGHTGYRGGGGGVMLTYLYIRKQAGYASSHL